MLISKQTKIAELLKHSPEALEAIITISPDFKKLRNPMLRRIMAGRTSIGMASKIGGCEPEDFIKVLRPLGFQWETDAKKPTSEEPEEISRKPLPEYLTKLAKDQIVRFDVRQILADGKDPLRDIQQKIKSLQPGQALNIINSFEPVPLVKLLEKQGFESFIDQVAPEQFESYFYKVNTNIPTELETDASTSGDWDEMLQKYEDNLVEIDVRHLEMPMPMMTILENLESLPEGKALYVNHKRIPVFLLTELKDRSFDYRIKDVAEGEVYLLIFKNH